MALGVITKKSEILFLMNDVKKFIDSLSQNYYLDFIVGLKNKTIDSTGFHLVEYQKKQYYEQKLNQIRIQQSEIINKVAKEYENALSEIFIQLSTSDFKNIDNVIKYTIQAIKLKLNTLKSDFYINNKRSRYCSTLVDNEYTQELSEIIQRSNTYEQNSENHSILNALKKLSFDKSYNPLKNYQSSYYLNFHHKRFKTLSYLPFALFNIASDFLNKLTIIEKDIEEINQHNETREKIKWTGKKTHIGYIFSILEQEGFIDTPKLKNGEVNYTAFSKLIKDVFDVDVKKDTLRKYLNPSDEKFVENKKTFDREDFHIPNVKLLN
ncbi:hypothetical protein [Tenacibaculum dicentrarchi]|uniref:hypothetical protein n=2 Tax=Tenacibaculum dicentrarchi TaxID=669041 RepID=UPI0035113BC4